MSRPLVTVPSKMAVSYRVRDPFSKLAKIVKKLKTPGWKLQLFSPEEAVCRKVWRFYFIC